MPIDSPNLFSEIQQKLEAREAVLRTELQSVDAELADDANQHFNGEAEDSGDEGERRIRTALRSAEQERDVAELREIVAAKARIASGQYGICTDCGVDIATARLQAQPAAIRCLECQETFERSHPAAARLPPME